MQKTSKGSLIQVASKIVSLLLGGEVMMVIHFILVFSLGKPSRSVYYLIMCITNAYFTIVFKLLFHNPRPYMVVGSEIKVVGTSSEFGDPSGHTMSSAQVMMTMFLDYLAEKP